MNRKLVVKLVVVAVGMFGFGFALAPMYTKLCELTGVNNLQSSDEIDLTMQSAAATESVATKRKVTLPSL